MATCPQCKSSVPDSGATTTWMYERVGGTSRYVCVPCARDRLDGIEARFDRGWFKPPG